MDELIQNLITFWAKGGDVGFALLGFLWFMFYAGRWYIIHRSHAFSVLSNRHDSWYRFFAGWRPKRVWTPFPPAFLILGLAAHVLGQRLEPWAITNPKPFLWIHGGLLLAGLFLILILRDREPKHVQNAKGRANSKWRDVMQDWGRTFRDSAGKTHTDKHPTAAIAVYRDPSKEAARGAVTGQRIKRNLTLVQLRWDIVSGHILILGSQGSGKTTTIYSHIMHSAHCPWIYQDSKAELPWFSYFSDRPVWGLDMRGHQTRSAIWNPLQEAKTSEDLDLLVDYIFPIRSQDANPWVRDLARTMFRAILVSKRWKSIQEIGRTLKATKLDQFLGSLPPIWRNLMAEPKSQVPVIQDLVVTLDRWCTPRVAAITEGDSTICLDDYLKRGGYVMNCEMSDDLRAPVHLFWAMILGRIRNRAENSSKILLLMDEFADAGRIPNIEQALILLRSKGAGVIAGVQNLGILEKSPRHQGRREGIWREDLPCSTPG